MSTRTVLNLALLLVVGALAAFAWLGPGPRPKPVAMPISRLLPAQIDTVRVQRGDGPPVVIERRGGTWRVSAPRDLPADARRVARILALATTVSHARYPLAHIDRQALGLDPPRARVTLNGETFLFGAQAPLDAQRYVQHGAVVHLITDTLFHQLPEGPAGYVDPRLLPAGAAIDVLKLPGLTVTRAGGGRWRLDPPRPGLSADAVNTLIDEWREARALEVRLSGTAAPAAAASIRIDLAGRSAPLTFRLDARRPELVLTRADLGLEYHLPGTAAKRLLGLAPRSVAAGKRP